MGDYEEETNEAIASVKLEQEQKKRLRKATSLADLLEFMETHQEFKEFYNLMKQAECLF